LVPGYHLLQGSPDNPDRAIFDLDPIQHRFDVGLPEQDRPSRDVLSHDLPEALDGLGIEGI
jgi:hypothetical protein